MAENNENGGTVPQQKSGVSPTVFWIVTVILAIGIGSVYLQLDKKLDDATKSLSDTLKASGEKQDKALAAQSEAINKTVKEGAEKQDAANKAVQEMIAKNQVEVTTSIASVRKDLSTTEKKVEGNIAVVADKLTTTSDNLGKVDSRVVYIEKDIKEMKDKLNGLDSQIGEIKTGSAALKAEQQRLLGEIKSIGSRSDVTQGELATLVQRTRDFEMKVLLEHARTAQKALTTGDDKSFLEQLEFKIDKKK